MHLNRKTALLALLVLSTTMGAKCITVNDDALVAVNIDDITGTYAVAPGATTFGAGNCVTKDASEYLDEDFTDIRNARLVDVKVQTSGQFPGTVTDGAITANGATVLSYSGPWNTFNTQQSLLSPATPLTTNPVGVAALIAAINAQEPVTICATGGFSQAATAGLSLTVTAFAQVDASID
jgi:hypothetical protein